MKKHICRAAVKAHDDGLMDAVVSTDAVDRVGDVIRQDGWDLDNYQKNPIVLWGHDYDRPAIGRAESIGVKDGSLQAKIRFAETPFAQEIKSLYEQGILSAFSVGFKPLESEKRLNDDDEVVGYEFTKQELLEFSAVNVPANPEALQLALTRGLIDETKSEFPAWSDRPHEKASKDGAANPKQKEAKAMSDELKGLTEKVEATDKRVTDATKSLDESVKALKDQGEQIQKQIEEQKALHEQHADWIKTVEEKATKIESASSTLEGDLLSAIDDTDRKYVDLFDALPNSAEKGRFQDPRFKAASALWFASAARVQSRSTAPELTPEIHEKRQRLEKAFNAHTKAAYTGGTDSTGGYAVPNIVQAEILRIALDSSVVASRSRHIPMTSDTLLIPNESNNFTVYFVSEAGTMTGGETTLGQNTLEAKKIVGRATASIEAEQDWVVALMPYVQGIIAEGIGRKLDSEALEGTGSNFTGVVTESAVNSVATTTTNGEAVTYLDLVNAVFSAGEESTREGAAWFMSPKIFATVVGLVDSNGQPIFQYANVPGMARREILGYPVYLTNALSTTITRGSTGNTGNIYFGNPANLIFGDRLGMRWDVTDAVNWGTGQIDMRLLCRHGFTVGRPAAWTKIVGCTQLS